MFHKANNKGADQAAHLRSLVCTFVVRMLQVVFFLASRPIYKEALTYPRLQGRIVRTCLQKSIASVEASLNGPETTKNKTDSFFAIRDAC